jgi:hypothetical protein
MRPEELFIHDSVIKSVTDNPDTDEVTFNINWLKDWDNNIYVDADLIFSDVLFYEVHEGPFSGKPSILSIIEDGHRTDNGVERIKYKIETNAGYRVLFCTGMNLIDNSSDVQQAD